MSFLSSLFSRGSKPNKMTPPKDEASAKATWLIAKSANPESGLTIFRYLASKPAGWKSTPLSEEVSLSWKFDGALPDESVQKRMNELEDALASLCEGKFSCLALVITTGGIREWCFYCRDYPDFMSGLNKCLSGRPAFPIAINHSPDADWKYWHHFVDQVARK